MAGETPLKLEGGFTADPELRYTKDGRPFLKATIASSPRRYNQQSGQWEDGDTLYMWCTLWDDLAINTAETCRKGTQVIASGNLTPYSYTDRNGQERSGIELRVYNLGVSLKRVTARLTRQERDETAPSRNSPRSTDSTDDPWMTPPSSSHNDPPF